VVVGTLVADRLVWRAFEALQAMVVWQALEEAALCGAVVAVACQLLELLWARVATVVSSEEVVVSAVLVLWPLALAAL
jgi:hypothetical protein